MVKLLTTREVARLCKVTPKTVTIWANQGRIRIAQKLPGKNGALLFEQADVAKARGTLEGRS